MSKWGATDPVPGDNWTPWGIPRWMLSAAKTITDPVHGDIYINAIEQRVIDSPPMQRLRRVRQLGTTHLVYPGAVHTRFSHSLGTLRAAQDLLDAVNDNHRRPHSRPDLFDEWEAAQTTADPHVRARKFAEATVLARLGALLHDLCHVPIGHTIEDDLTLLDPHDKNPARFERLWNQLDPEVLAVIDAYKPEDGAPTFKEELEHLIVSKVEADDDKPWTSRYPFVEDIVGNTICADLIDYLQRDHYYTGLPMQIGHRFVDHFYVTPSTNTLHAQRMVIRTTRDGQRRQDVITELEKYLRYRYELTERVLTHHAKTSADAMIGKLLEMWNDAMWRQVAAERHADVIARLDSDANIDNVRDAVIASQAAEDAAPGDQPQPTAVEEIDSEVKRRLEDQFLLRSDDGILEHLIEQSREPNRGERWQGIGTLATAVLDRQLFKRAARADSDADRANVRALYKKFGSAADRRRLEQEAARYAQVKPGWKVVIWLPSPSMRMKVAKVLVDNEEGVAALADVTGDSGQIVEAHKRLWGITVYVSPDLKDDHPVQVATMLAYLRESLGVSFHDSKGNLIERPADLALRLYSEQAQMTPARTKQLRDALEEPDQVAAARASRTFEDRLQQIDFQAHHRNLVTDEKRPTVTGWTDWQIPAGAQ